MAVFGLLLALWAASPASCYVGKWTWVAVWDVAYYITALPLATCIQRRRYANKCVWTLVGLYWQGKTDVLGNNPVLAPIRPPQISQRPAWDPTHALAVAGRRHVWHMAGPAGVACYVGKCVAVRVKGAVARDTVTHTTGAYKDSCLYQKSDCWIKAGQSIKTASG